MMTCGFVHVLYGALLVVSNILQGSCSILQQKYRCLLDVPEVYPKQQLFIKGEPRPILLDGRPGVNPSMDFTNHLVKILAEEVLGYQDVRILNSEVDFHDSAVALRRISGCKDTSCRAVLMSDDISSATINMEVWQDNLLEMSLWQETGTVKLNGFLGFSTRYGWFISQSLVAQMWDPHKIIADHWKSLQSNAMIQALHIPLSELRGLVRTKTTSDTKEREQGTKTRYYCERTECVKGFFVPPVCAGVDSSTATEECSTLIAGYPDTSFDLLIGQITSLRLPVVVAWIGPNIETYVNTRSLGNKPTMFLSWTPHTLTSSGLYSRISFPTCVEGMSSTDANSGCDFHANPVTKLTWFPLSYSTPDLDAMITGMSFDDFEMLVVLGQFLKSKGESTESDSMLSFACDWLKKNKATWRKWVPDTENPKKKIYLGGLFPDYLPALSGIGVGARLAVDAVNADVGVLGAYELELVVDGSDGSNAVASYLRLQDDKTKLITGVIGPMRSEDCKIVASIASLYKTVVISYGADSPALSNQNQYPYLASVMPNAVEEAHAYTRFFDNYSWKRYAALSDSSLANLEVITATERILEDQGIKLVSSQSFNNPLPLNPTLFFEDIKNQNAHIIIGLFSEEAARVLLCEAYKQDVTGYKGFQWFLPSHYSNTWWDTDYFNDKQRVTPESVPCGTQEMEDAVAGYMSLSRLHVARGTEPVIGSETAAELHRLYLSAVAKQGKQASDIAAYAYDAVWAFALAYNGFLLESQSGSLTAFRRSKDMSSIMGHLSKTQFQGMSGKVVFDGRERRGAVVVSQHLPQGSKVITPVARYVPYMVNSSEWTGRLELNASDIVWLNDGEIPDDGDAYQGDCAVESFRVFLGVSCESAVAILNAFLIIVILIILIIFIVLIKKAYDRKIKKAEARVKDLGIIALGQSTLLSLDKWEIAREDVILNRKLGEGAFGMVYGGEARLSGSQWVGVAVKTLKVESTIEEKLDFLSEAEMMKRFDHPNIVRLLGVCTRREPIYTIMDFMLHGDLKTFLLARRHLVNQSHTSDETVSPERLTSMVLDVATGVSYLARNKYVHRDLACRNCLVDSSYTVKLADFGMTRAMYDSNYYRFSREGKMPVRWMAPESINEGIFTTKSDIWSLGIVLYEVVTFGGFPYKDLSNADVLDYIRNNNTMRPPADCTSPLTALMQRCWSIQPDDRPTANHIVETLSTHRALIRPSIGEPMTSILEEDPGLRLSLPKVARTDSFRSDVTDLNPADLSRSEQVASLGRKLRTSFIRKLSSNRRHSHGVHNVEMSLTERRQKLESSTQELVPSTLSVISSTTRSSLASLDQSATTSFRSTPAQRDSSSSSGVDCTITEFVSVEIPVQKRTSTQSSVFIDGVVGNEFVKVPRRKTGCQPVHLPCGFVVQVGDEMHLLPSKPKARQQKRSRSRSLGNIKAPRIPKLSRSSYVESQDCAF